MLSLLRVIKFAIQDMARNFGLSFMTILILVLMLLSINTLIGINILTGEAVGAVKSQINVSIFFNEDASEDEIDEIKTFVNSFPEVTEVIFYDENQVLEQFRAQHEENPEVLAALEELGENPLGSTMIVKTREPKDYEDIIAALNVPEYENIIESKTFGDTEKAIERIHIITTQVEKFGIGLSILFAFIAFLIIFNTIRVAIYTQRREISIKKLVGATNWFVRGPYIFESIFFSIISTIIAYGLVVLALSIVDPYINIVFGRPYILTSYYQSNIVYLLGIQFGCVLLLTMFTSTLAMRRYLRA